MNEAHLSEANFEPKDFVPLPMDDTDWITKEVVPVIIRIDKSLKDRIIELFGEENIITRDEDNYIAKYPIVDNEEGYNVLLKFGSKCEVIKPISVRENFKKYLMEITNIYK